jgi:integrase
VGDVLISPKTYKRIEEYFLHKKTPVFKIRYQAYVDDIRETCKRLNIDPKGSHGFRWTFAQNRVREYQKHGYTYEQALQGVSWEMKHFRASITEHYLG